ncbi:Lrp/AsnC family transcriptional regulator [Fulvimarina endophytica]|uniref:Lrp/AsnC family transcriptional regulator n=1 Tax=Fulvimarina endophytica TaxID=2293836 RepID=A0A371X471_9HYPH|nr:Lrp/AsnC family transcriptional regulator [Fulvimarina endophytica]RFC64028.1 Lrp/AsnC family transcriptional regulator [Fulvimarina endophytica]
MNDERDRQILSLMQENAEISLAEIADRVSLSPSACSRRLARLRAEGYITGTMAILDRRKINLPTTVFVLVRTGRHAEDWIERFHRAVAGIAEIMEVHRLTGNYDYILKIVLPDIEYYDTVYKQLLRRIELYDVSAYISMETVKPAGALPTSHMR